jgi:hypothetical protein
MVNLKLIIEGLEELSDLDYQTRVWNPGETLEVSSFTEAIARVFTDSGLDDVFRNGKTAISKDVDALLIKLGYCVDGVDAQRKPDEIIYSEEMKQVRLLAKEALSALRAL